MDTYMHKTMASIASLEKIEIIRSQEFMPSKVRLKFLKKMIMLGPKTAILGPQFCRILVLGPHFWWSGGAWAPRPPGSTPEPPISKALLPPRCSLLVVYNPMLLIVDCLKWAYLLGMKTNVSVN